MQEPVFFDGAAEWRAWLERHHEDETECLVGLHKIGSGDANLSWSESVDEALCFGWIDGVRRSIDDRSYSIRFTPRKPGSNWSAVNMRKVEALRAEARMTEAGERAFASRQDARSAVYAYEQEPQGFAADQQTRFEAETEAWVFFAGQAAWYRRNATHWVVSAKRPDTREKRLVQLIEDSGAGRWIRHLSRDRRQ